MSQERAEHIGSTQEHHPQPEQQAYSEEQQRAADSLCSIMFDLDAGLFPSAQLILHYSAAERFAISDDQEVAMCGEYYSNRALAHVLSGIHNSNFLASPFLWRLLPDQDESRFKYRAELVWQAAFSFILSRLAETDDDHDFITAETFVLKLQEVGVIQDQQAVARCLSELEFDRKVGDIVSLLKISRNLLRAGLADVPSYATADMLVDLDETNDLLYLMKVEMLLLQLDYIHNALQKTGLSRFDIDILAPNSRPGSLEATLPQFSQALTIAEYIAQEARWIDSDQFVGSEETYPELR